MSRTERFDHVGNDVSAAEHLGRTSRMNLKATNVTVEAFVVARERRADVQPSGFLKDGELKIRNSRFATYEIECS